MRLYSILLLILLVFSGISYANFNEAHSVISDRYKKELACEYQNIMQEFFDLFGITAYEFEEFKKTCQSAYDLKINEEIAAVKDTCNLEVNKTLQEKIERVLAQSPVKHAVQIIRMHSKHNYDIEAMLRVLFVDEHNFYATRFTDDEIDATLWHEIQHILFKDGFVLFCFTTLSNHVWHNQVWKLSDQNPTLANRWRRLINFFYVHDFNKRFNVLQHKLTLFQEKRADILSGLVSPVYARAWVALANRSLHGQHHPHPQERAAYMQKLALELENAENY